MDRLPKSGAAIGHVRYSTTGGNTKNNVQPIITEFLTGRIATAPTEILSMQKSVEGKAGNLRVDFAATTDSEVISSLIAYKTLKTGNVFDGVVVAAKELVGAFSLVVLTGDHKLIVVRDPNGFRPLCIDETLLASPLRRKVVRQIAVGFRLSAMLPPER